MQTWERRRTNDCETFFGRRIILWLKISKYLKRYYAGIVCWWVSMSPVLPHWTTLQAIGERNRKNTKPLHDEVCTFPPLPFFFVTGDSRDLSELLLNHIKHSLNLASTFAIGLGGPSGSYRVEPGSHFTRLADLCPDILQVRPLRFDPPGNRQVKIDVAQINTIYFHSPWIADGREWWEPAVPV